jgi:uncharacterized protein GlcG (DUF336 family)
MAAAEAECDAHGWPMVIAIVDSGGNLVMLHALDQAQHGSLEIAQRKAATAVNFRRPSKAFEDIVAGGGSGLRILSMPNVTALEGGVPILVDGQVIGAIGVSGMRSDQDAQVAYAGIKAITG